LPEPADGFLSNLGAVGVAHRLPCERVSSSRKERGRERKGHVVSDDKKLLTKGEVALLCRVDIRTVDRWLTAGKLRCQRTPSGRVLFRAHDVLTIVAPAKTSLRGRER
jgi:hypothetical protein